VAAAIVAIGLGAVARAQLPAPNPLVAPVPAPSAPSPLAPPVPPQGLPSLAVVASPPASSPTPAPRVFNCSCYGPATPTSFVGQVIALSFFTARQAATSACLTYNERKEVAPPVMPLRQGTQFAPAVTGPQGFENPNLANAVPGTLPGTLNFTTTALLNACSQCTCD
jgi:hypothetical protein